MGKPVRFFLPFCALSMSFSLLMFSLIRMDKNIRFSHVYKRASISLLGSFMSSSSLLFGDFCRLDRIRIKNVWKIWITFRCCSSPLSLVFMNLLIWYSCWQTYPLLIKYHCDGVRSYGSKRETDRLRSQSITYLIPWSVVQLMWGKHRLICWAKYLYCR